MFCKNCGKEIDDNAVVCPACGVATDKMKEAAAANNIAENKVNVYAIVGFALSVVAFVFMWLLAIIFYIAVIAAIVLCIVGLVFSKKYTDKGLGKGLSIAGISVSGASVIIYIIIICIAISYL